MKIGIIGAGNIGGNLARRLVPLGIRSRSPIPGARRRSLTWRSRPGQLPYGWPGHRATPSW
jgi:hypothetical protein